MNQELKAFRDWLRMYRAGGISMTGAGGAHFEMTEYTARELAGILDNFQYQSEHAGGEKRDV